MNVAFLFPGQGAQSVGMGRQLYETQPAARRLFDDAADILGYKLIDVCVNGPAEKLNSTAVSQPAIFVASLAALESLRASAAEAERQCVATAGLSLGGRGPPARPRRSTRRAAPARSCCRRPQPTGA